MAGGIEMGFSFSLDLLICVQFERFLRLSLHCPKVIFPVGILDVLLQLPRSFLYALTHV